MEAEKEHEEGMRCKAMRWRGGEQVEGKEGAQGGHPRLTSLPQAGRYPAANTPVRARQEGVRVKREGLHGSAIRPSFPQRCTFYAVLSHVTATKMWPV